MRDAALAVHGLSLAAAPALAGMALLSAASADAAPFVCGQGGSTPGGMTAMYAIMAVLHLAPWLRLWAPSR